MKVFKLLGTKRDQSLYSFKGIKPIHDDNSPRNDLQTAMAVIQWLNIIDDLISLLWDDNQPLLWDDGTPIVL